MRKILILLIIAFSSYKVSAQVAIGAEGGLLPLGSYPAYYNQFLKGGFKSGPDHASRDSYPENMRDTQNFIFYTFNDNSFWVLQGGVSNDRWVKLDIGAGSPAGLAAGAVLPAGPQSGQTFFLTTDKRFYVYNGTDWIAADNRLDQGKFFVGNTNGQAESLDKSSIPLSGFGKAEAHILMGDSVEAFQIKNLSDPVDARDAATKGYVDSKPAGSDGLGDHTASRNVVLGSYSISNDGVAGKGLTFDADGNAYLGQDLTVNNNMLTPSDQRLKHRIQVLQGVLEALDKVRGVQFEYIDQRKYARGPKIGVIAQELREVYPALVTLGTDGFYKVDYTQLTGILIQASKELRALMETADQRILDLEKQVEEQRILLEKISKKLLLDR